MPKALRGCKIKRLVIGSQSNEKFGLKPFNYFNQVDHIIALQQVPEQGFIGSRRRAGLAVLEVRAFARLIDCGFFAARFVNDLGPAIRSSEMDWGMTPNPAPAMNLLAGHESSIPSDLRNAGRGCDHFSCLHFDYLRCAYKSPGMVPTIEESLLL